MENMQDITLSLSASELFTSSEVDFLIKAVEAATRADYTETAVRQMGKIVDNEMENSLKYQLLKSLLTMAPSEEEKQKAEAMIERALQKDKQKAKDDLRKTIEDTVLTCKGLLPKLELIKEMVSK